MIPMSKIERQKEAIEQPREIIRELCDNSFFFFLKEMWPVVSSDRFQANWHIEYLCGELQKMAERVSQRLPREYDLVINVPPGTTKTITCSIMFPVWCWTKWPWMRFICSSYSAALSLESADYSRDLVRSPAFKYIYPDIKIKKDKDNKSNYRVVRTSNGRIELGGNRFSTSVGGSLTGFHGHFLIIDDPLNPEQAVSEVELANSIHWLDNTLPTRKTDKKVTPTILIMQRLHQGDPSGHLLDKTKIKVKHICLPGEIRSPGYADKVKPPELQKYYIDGLLDSNRMDAEVLADLEERLGQYGYASQIGQYPVPPAGGMFKVDRFNKQEYVPIVENIKHTIRYWDKAGSKDSGAYTVGVKLCKLANGKFMVMDVRRGRWSTEEREAIIRSTAEADGNAVEVWVEQEPGSGGKESAESTIKNLAGYAARADLPRGDKIFRADPLSVQVNIGNVILINSDWNKEFIEEFRYFPFSKFKDQVDATSGAFSKLAMKREVRIIR